MTFPIDLVVTWVHIDKKHEEMKRLTLDTLKNGHKKTGGHQVIPKRLDSQVTRFRDNSEILFCLRSIQKNLPWIRCIFIVVADYQAPDKYFNLKFRREDQGTKIQIIRHSEIFEDHACLPTFNSQAIEANLHNIPGLAEQFLYANDDFYVGKSLDPSFFFDLTYGFPRSLLEESFIAHGPKMKGMNMHSMAWINNAELLDATLFPSAEEATMAPKRRYPSHVIQPLLKSSFKEAQKNSLIKYCFARTTASPFRTPLDVYPIGFIIYWNLIRGMAVAQSSAELTLFHDLERGDDVNGLMKFIQESRPSLFCVNDGGYNEQEGAIMRSFLRKIFPDKAPWEL